MPWVWVEEAYNYRDTETGKFIRRSTILRLVRDSLESARTAEAITLSGGVQSAGTDMLANLVANDMLSVSDWHVLMREEIKREYVRLYAVGYGGQARMTAKDWGSIGGMLAEQYRKLGGFADDIAAGRLTEDQIKARAFMYVNSAREAFEKAYARALGIPEGELPAHPGDGSTICLTNCNCNWEHERVYDNENELVGWDSTWVLGPVKTKHCETCLKRAKEWAPYEVRL